MKKERAMLWITGLNTPVDSDWCGIRTFLEKLAARIDADLLVHAWDEFGAMVKTLETLGDYEFLFAGGHSLGAWKLYQMLGLKLVGADVAAFLDLCPYGDPTAWMGGPWAAPANVDRNLCFFQRNDTPLAGVRMIGAGATGKAVELIDATAWGLHHGNMPGDLRVQNRIEMAVLEAVAEQLRVDAGFGAGGQTIPQTSLRTENA